MKKAALMFCGILIVSGFSFAQFYPGKELLNELTSSPGTEMENATACGYVIGVFDATVGIAHEPPADVDFGQVLDIVIKYLTDNPERLHEVAALLVTQALTEAFPKKKEHNEKNRNP